MKYESPALTLLLIAVVLGIIVCFGVLKQPAAPAPAAAPAKEIPKPVPKPKPFIDMDKG